MNQLIRCSSAVLLLAAALAFAQEGELRGKITDKNSGQPVAGVTITLEEFERQAVADDEGEFILLGLWPGKYAVRLASTTSEALVIEAVAIHAFTTTRLEVQWAERAEASSYSIKLIESAGTVHRIEQNYIQNTPVRGLEKLLKLETGVLEQNGELYIRGGFASELTSFLNGVNASSLLANNGAATIEAVPEAIEEIQLYSGAFGAELGNSNLAPVHTILRSGGEKLHATLDYRTDDLAKPGEQFLGTSSFGYRHAVVTIGGPLGAHARYFLAGQHGYMRNRTVSFVEPFRFENLTDDGLEGRPAGEPLPDAIAYERNYLPHNWLQNNTVQGNLLFAKAAFNLRLTGAYAHDNRPLGTDTFTGSLNNYFNLERSAENTAKTGLLSLRATHALSAKSFYAINLSYSQQSFTNADPAFGDDWMSYGDSTKVTPLGYSDWRELYYGPLPHSVIINFQLAARGTPINNFQKGRQSHLGLATDFTALLHSNWKIKTGLRFDRWSLRNYRVSDIQSTLVFLYGRDGKLSRTFPSPEQRALELSRWGAITYLGYDVDGKEVDSGANGPRSPNLFSAYLQSEYQWQRVLLNVGLRYERVATKAIVLTPVDDPLLDLYEESEAPPTNHFLPRFGFTLPVLREHTVLHCSFGKYLTPFGFLGLNNAASGYGFNYVLASGEPASQTKYEIGVRHSFAGQLKASAVYFSRNEALLSDARGVELNVSLTRNSRWQAGLRYTWTDFVGDETGPTRVLVSDGTVTYPVITVSNDAATPHRGLLLLDYRFPQNESSVLQGFGLHAILSATTGHYYTMIEAPLTLGQSNPYNIGVRSLLNPLLGDATYRVRTPWNFQIDLGLNKIFALGNVDLEIYIHALNLLNKKNVLNVYPTTGEPDDDGWLNSPLAEQFKQIPNYEAFYRAVNLDNRWAYTLATGNDIYGQPRQLRVGLRLGL